MEKIKSIIDDDFDDLIQYHNTILQELESKFTNVLLYVQSNDEFILNVVPEDESDLINKIKIENEAMKNFDLKSSNSISIYTLLEYRPNEKRDKNDFSETGALNAIANVEVKHLINEDIMNLDIEKMARLCSKSNYTNATFSIQCDEFSNVKANSLKDSALDDGTSSLDMVIDAVNIISKFNFPTVLVENVPNFFTSDAGKILIARLNRLGYKTYVDKFDARDYGGLTSRVRGYLFATMLPSKFVKPKPTNKNNIPIWDLLKFDERIVSGELRDVTHTSSLQDGLKTGRARLLKRDSLFSPTVLKSQNRQAKDSLFIHDEVNEKYYFTSNKLLSELMGIKMDFSAVGGTIESEIVGQSIEVPFHEQLLDSINLHIMESNQILFNKLF